MSNIFLSLQLEIKALLQAQSYFNTIPIVTEDKGDILSELNKALAEGAVATASAPKVGIAIVILTPTSRNAQPDRRDVGVADMDIKLLVGVFENVPINTDPTTGINKRALDVVQNVIHYVVMKQAVRGFTQIKFDTFDSSQLPEISSVNYNIFFDARRTLNAASS